MHSPEKRRTVTEEATTGVPVTDPRDGEVCSGATEVFPDEGDPGAWGLRV
jgi:hypothetical protein